MLEAQLTDRILGSFYPVYNDLGFGFSEPVYSNSMCIELQSHGISAKREVLTEVLYRGVVVGKYRIDLLVEVGLLLHFGPKPAFRRLIYTNDRK